MKLVRGTPHPNNFAHGVVATIGNFDGVHLGHQNLIKSLIKRAVTMRLPSVVITFEPQPKEYFQKNEAPVRLSSLREKLEIFKKCQVDYVYCIKFDEKLAQTSPKDFAIKHLFSQLNVKTLLVGEDFRFGKNRAGDVELLKALGNQYGCEIALATDFCVQGEKISSTKIRTALQKGDLKTAQHFLGRCYDLCGRVVPGQGRGRQWGIPTANLSFHRTSMPIQGVFVVEMQIAGKRVQGVANAGKRPTVDGSKNILEVHLFDFNKSIYGQVVQVFFLHKVREEVKFTSVEALIEQINKDIAIAKAYFANTALSNTS